MVNVGPSGSTHTSAEELEEYYGGGLQAFECAAIEDHVAECTRCAELAGRVRRLCAVWDNWNAESHRKAIQREREAGQRERSPLQTAKAWLTPPRPLEVALFLAGQSPDDQAMRSYLSRPEAQAGRHLLNSRYVHAIADLLRLGAATTQSRRQKGGELDGLAREFFDSMVAATTRSARLEDPSDEITTSMIYVLAARTSAETSIRSEDAAGGSLTVSTTDRSATADIALLGSERVNIRVTSGSEHSGRKVFVEVLSDNVGSVHGEIQLVQHELADEADGESTITVPNAEAFLRNCTVLIAWIPED